MLISTLTLTLLTPAVFGQLVSKCTYFAGTVLNPNESGVTATFNVHGRDRSLMGTRADSIEGKRTASRALQYSEGLVSQDIASDCIRVTVDSEQRVLRCSESTSCPLCRLLSAGRATREKDRRRPLLSRYGL